MLKTITYTIGKDEAVVTDTIDFILKQDIKQSKVQWTHLQGDTAEDMQVLGKLYSFNELSIVDSQRDRHPPKFETFDNYAFIILRPIEFSSKFNCEFTQLSLFLGKQYLVTKSFKPIKSLDSVWDSYTNNNFDSTRSVRNLTYKIFRGLADDYFSVIQLIELDLEEIEDNIENDANDSYLAKLTKHNSNLRKIVRNLEYQEDVASKLIKHDIPIENKQIEHEFNDVYEQIERVLTLAKMYQGLCNDLINTHISITSHRVNKVVKALTIVTVLFLPLSFIAGLYGMNFEFIPELKLKYGYFYILGLMVVIEILLLILLKKIKWI